MFRLRRTHLLILISFQLLSSLALGQTSCDPNNRPSAASCNSLPTDNVCGYTDVNCPIELCGKSYRNGCAACADVNVDHYTIGQCSRDVELQTCSGGYCPLKERERYNPVCGYGTENGEVVTETFYNYCTLCDDDSFYTRFTYGVCKDERKLCTPGKLGCTQEKDVCAFLYGSIPTTVPSIAEACEDPAVAYFIKGECGPLVDDARYCLPNNRPEECDQEYDPVCGFFKDENGQTQNEIISSECAACSDPNIIYWTPGACVFKCDVDPNMVYDCSGEIDPVCGTYIENGVEKRASFKNDCLGCYYGGREILGWTEGLCPGDKGILCENDSETYEDFDQQPVCGYFTPMDQDCDNFGCKTNYWTSRVACADTWNTVIWWSPGPCDGVEEEEEGSQDG